MSGFAKNAESSMGAFSKADDLKKRILYTLLILIIYRFGTYVPLPGIDPTSLKEIVGGDQRSLLGMFNVFAGGAVQRMAIFALGIMPYISASIIIQLLTGVTEYFKNLYGEDIPISAHPKIRSGEACLKSSSLYNYVIYVWLFSGIHNW